MLITGPSESGKTNATLIFNLIQQQDKDSLIDKIYLYAKDLGKPKYQFLIKKREDSGIKKKMTQVHSNTMDDVYNNIDDFNNNRKRNSLLIFGDMVVDEMTNINFQAITNELFISCRKLNTFPVFIRQSYFSVPKAVRLNSTHYLIMKNLNK